jgi:hypothetical protein
VNLWNPRFPVSELTALSDQLKRRLYGDDFRTIGRLDRCSDEKLQEIGYNSKAIENIRAAMTNHRNWLAHLADFLLSEGLTEKTLCAAQVFDLLSLPITSAQLGYLVRWQRDVGGRYTEKDMFCVAGGRVYYCTKCPYRDERSNFCGVCYQKLLNEMKEGKHFGV